MSRKTHYVNFGVIESYVQKGQTEVLRKIHFIHFGSDVPDALPPKDMPLSRGMWKKSYGECRIKLSAVAVMVAAVVFVCCVVGSCKSSTTSLDGHEWTVSLGVDQETVAYDVALDTHGNICIAGDTKGSLDRTKSAGKSDAFLAKYTSNGDRIWVTQWGT